MNGAAARAWLAAVADRPAAVGRVTRLTGRPPRAVEVAIAVTPPVALATVDYDAIERELTAIAPAGRSAHTTR